MSRKRRLTQGTSSDVAPDSGAVFSPRPSRLCGVIGPVLLQRREGRREDSTSAKSQFPWFVAVDCHENGFFANLDAFHFSLRITQL